MNNNSKQSNPFSFLDIETAEESTTVAASLYQIEAYQVVKIGGRNTISRNREVIDTIYVKDGSTKFAQEKAQSKADLIAQVMHCDCMVIEKLERLVSTHYKE